MLYLCYDFHKVLKFCLGIMAYTVIISQCFRTGSAIRAGFRFRFELEFFSFNHKELVNEFKLLKYLVKA